MYNCLRFCRRVLNINILETAVRPNRKLLPDRGFIPKHFNSISSAFKRGSIVTKEEIANFDELVTYISNLHRVQAEQISELFTAIKDDNLTEKQVLLLLEYCSNSIPSGNITKNDLLESVLKRYEKTGNFSEKVYECYINNCTRNRQCLDAESLILSLGSNISPNILKLLLVNVCENGDREKAIKVLAEMKKRKYNLDEGIFNTLVLVYTIQGGLPSGLEIIKSMNLSKIEESSNTFFSIIKGLAQRNDVKIFRNALEQYKISYSEDMVLSLLESLGLSGNHTWVQLLTKLVNISLFSRYFSTQLQQLCMKLVHNGKYDAAFEIYKTFETAQSDSAYAGFILREMLLCFAPVDKIVEFAKDLKKSGLNEYALENVTESALRNRMFITALALLAHFHTLRPHYFWPMLIEAHDKEGEVGLLEITRTAFEMNVKFDSESFQSFILPRCNLTEPQRVLQMFQEVGYTVRELLSPMIIALLRRKDVHAALQLCGTYKDVKIESEYIIYSLTITWLVTANHHACISLLQKVSENSGEVLLGKFLVAILERMKRTNRMICFLELLKECKRRHLMINSVSADLLLAIINKDFHVPEIMTDINDAINDILDFSKIPTAQPFLHPRDMTTEQLEMHLIELKAKGMETRGVLRRLIQRYSGNRNPQRVNELREELSQKGYSSSPGMKSSLLHSHVQEGNLEAALEIYEDLKTTVPSFRMDTFKIVDLARLLVKNDCFDEAVQLVKDNSERRSAMESSRPWARNCVDLLKSIQDVDKQNLMFELLVDCGYCEPSNVVLGAIIQLHLEKKTLEEAVDRYVDICQNYKQTPMQVVLLSETLKSGNDQLLRKVLDASTEVHGLVSAQGSLLAAMCEQGLTKQLVTVLQDSRINPTIDLEKRCDRWVQKNNMTALRTLLAASKELPPKLLNIPKIQLSIMRVYSKRNDCDGALAFWKQLVDEEDHVNPEVDDEFCELLSRCKFSSPENLAMKYKLK